MCVEAWALSAVDPELAATFAEELVAALSESVELPGLEETPSTFSQLGAKSAAVVLGACAAHLPGEVLVLLVRALIQILVDDGPPCPREAPGPDPPGPLSETDSVSASKAAVSTVTYTATLRGAGALAAGVLADLCAAEGARRFALPLVVTVAVGRRPETLERRPLSPPGSPVSRAAQRLAVQVLLRVAARPGAADDMFVVGAPAAMLQLLGVPSLNPEASGLATCVCLQVRRAHAAMLTGQWNDGLCAELLPPPLYSSCSWRATPRACARWSTGASPTSCACCAASREGRAPRRACGRRGCTRPLAS